MEDSRVLVGRNTADDAGVVQISENLALVHTVDLLAPVVDDPYTYGRIAAVNSLSDVYAMGGRPISALNVIGFPANLGPEVMGEILRGGQDAIMEAGAVLVGGHTFQNTEVMYGLAVTGEISPDQIYTNSNARPGDLLVLTKPLGTGTLIQAMMTRGVIAQSLYDRVSRSMTSSNRIASEAMIHHSAHACTDITGFGFIGHCSEMAEASGVGMNIRADMLPVFTKVMDMIRDGVTDAGVKMNRNSFEKMVSFGSDVSLVYEALLYGSETSGGLLIALQDREAVKLVNDLTDQGWETAVVVGEVVAEHPGRINIG